MTDLTKWFREDVSRWHALSPAVQRALARHSPIPKPVVEKVAKKRGGPKGPTDATLKIIAALKGGMSTIAAAKRFRLTRQRIHQIGQQNGVFPKREKLKPQIIAALKSGLSVATVAKRFHLGSNYIYQIRKKDIGFERPSLKARDLEILKDVDSGLTFAEVGKRFGLSYQRISKIVRNERKKETPHSRRGRG